MITKNPKEDTALFELIKMAKSKALDLILIAEKKAVVLIDAAEIKAVNLIKCAEGKARDLLDKANKNHALIIIINIGFVVIYIGLLIIQIIKGI